MTASRFVEYCENYFGEKLHDDARSVIVSYLKRFSDGYRAALVSVVIRRHPRRYGRCPGIEELEEYGDEALTVMDERRGADLTRKALTERPEDETMVEADLHALVESLAKAKGEK